MLPFHYNVPDHVLYYIYLLYVHVDDIYNNLYRPNTYYHLYFRSANYMYCTYNVNS